MLIYTDKLFTPVLTWEDAQTLTKEKLVFASPAGQECVALAQKYDVPFINGKAKVGCPGIMNPLGETPAIELKWGSGSHNQDKTDRFFQFHQALKL